MGRPVKPVKLIPLGERVLLKKIESDTRGGLRIPNSLDADEHTQEFEIVALPGKGVTALQRIWVGDHSTELAYDIVIGSRIYLARHKGYKIETNDGEELYVAEVADILVVEVPEAEQAEVEAASGN